MTKTKKLIGMLAGGVAVAAIAVGTIAGPASAAKPPTNFAGTFIPPAFTASPGDQVDLPLTWKSEANYLNNKNVEITFLSPTGLQLTNAPAYLQSSTDGVTWTNLNMAVKCDPKGKTDTSRMKCVAKPPVRSPWNWPAQTQVRVMIPMYVKAAAIPGNTVQAGIAQIKFSSATPKVTGLYLPVDTNAAYTNINIVR